MPKFNAEERRLIDITVGALSIKRIPDPDIIDQVIKLTNKKITRQTLYNIRQRIKLTRKLTIILFIASV